MSGTKRFHKIKKSEIGVVLSGDCSAIAASDYERLLLKYDRLKISYENLKLRCDKHKENVKKRTDIIDKYTFIVNDMYKKGFSKRSIVRAIGHPINEYWVDVLIGEGGKKTDINIHNTVPELHTNDLNKGFIQIVNLNNDLKDDTKTLGFRVKCSIMIKRDDLERLLNT